MAAPMLVPTMRSIGTCALSRTSRTPTCAKPFAPPPESTSVTPGGFGKRDASASGWDRTVLYCAMHIRRRIRAARTVMTRDEDEQVHEAYSAHVAFNEAFWCCLKQKGTRK